MSCPATIHNPPATSATPRPSEGFAVSYMLSFASSFVGQRAEKISADRPVASLEAGPASHPPTGLNPACRDDVSEPVRRTENSLARCLAQRQECQTLTPSRFICPQARGSS
ncbi:hypothetical protein DHEL01_v201722 [Diaporthe helianthi]|uniref:Uncharacterized protein n=1 Tax=Diaporthe helianthi TaxID=158607 RepID=A0A2P5IBJ2_DIAHE|nr:hypothetical protein DHEL01_v201722 [Diaporthe helianthi]